MKSEHTGRRGLSIAPENALCICADSHVYSKRGDSAQTRSFVGSRIRIVAMMGGPRQSCQIRHLLLRCPHPISGPLFFHAPGEMVEL